MKRRRTNYFEGWYLKHTIEDEVFAFVISLHEVANKEPYCCIQFINGNDSYTKEVLLKDCKIGEGEFRIIADNNLFSSQGINVDMEFGDVRVRCNLIYGEMTPLNSHIMGPFRYLPGMQCSHDVLSLAHCMTGFIEMNGRYIPLDKGVGYIERDSGSSFPQYYGWTQTNFFSEGCGSIMMACASIPYGGVSFLGTICTVLYRGEQYRLATYNGARVRKLDGHKMIIQNKDMVLSAKVLNQKPMALAAPDMGDMTRVIYESAKSEVRYRLYIKGRKIFDFVSDTASYEYSEK